MKVTFDFEELTVDNVQQITSEINEKIEFFKHGKEFETKLKNNGGLVWNADSFLCEYRYKEYKIFIPITNRNGSEFCAYVKNHYSVLPLTYVKTFEELNDWISKNSK